MMFCLLFLAFLPLGWTQTDFSFTLEVTNITTTSISLRYSVNPFEGVVVRANITSVYSGECSGPVPTRSATLEGFSDSYTISNLEDYSEYEITVILTLTGVRMGTKRIHERTLGTVPGPPPNFRQTAATMFSITLAWDPIPCLEENSQIEQFSITYTMGSSSMEEPVSSSATQYTIMGLAPGTSYSITFSVSYSVGDGGSPLTTIVTPQPITASTFTIPGPFNLRTAVNETSIRLRWSQENPSSSIIIQYNLSAIYVGPCAGIVNTATAIVTNRRNIMRQYRFTNLLSFGTYQLTITAISRNMQTATSSITASTLSRVPVGTPLSLHVVERDVFSLLVAWSPPDCEERQGEILSYDLYYETTTTSNIGRQQIQAIASTRQSITGLTPDTSYSIQIAANNIEGRGPFTETIDVRTLEPEPGVTDLQVDISSVQSTSAAIRWSRTPGLSYFLTLEYLGPCSGANVVARRQTVNAGSQEDHLLTGLEPHSQYLVSVWPTQSLSNATVVIETATADPFIRDGYVKLRDVNETSITLDVPPLDCIDQNTEISSLYTIRYGEFEGFQSNTGVNNNSFSPGVLTIGSLSPATNYSFEIIISTVDGRVIVLPTVTNNTIGSPLASTSRPTIVSTPAPTAQLPIFVVIIVAVIVVCIVVALVVILAICCISSLRRTYQRKKRQDQNELNRMSRIAMALRERDAQQRKPPSEASSTSDIDAQNNSRPFSAVSSLTSRKSNPFSEDMKWMSGMTQNTTLERENIELYQQMKSAENENLLVYDEKDFEYKPEGDNAIQQNLEGEGTGMEGQEFEDTKLEDHNFVDEIAKLVQQSFGEETTKQEEKQNFTYVEGGYEDEEDNFDFEGLAFQTANL